MVDHRRNWGDERVFFYDDQDNLTTLPHGISLALNYSYGWAGNINLKFIFDNLFSLKEFGRGYPPHRQESQQQSIKTLKEISVITHSTFAEIVSSINEHVIHPVLSYPGVVELIDIDSIQDTELKDVFRKRRI